MSAARVTLVSDGQVARQVDLAVAGPTVYVRVRLIGPAAQKPMSYRVQLVDDQGHVVKVQPYGEAGTKPADTLSYRMESCAQAEDRVDRRKPKAPALPSSDKAGLASCLKLATDDGADLDLDLATAKVTISSTREWGAVLSDGTRVLGCSLYPTKEISAAEPVTSDPPTTQKAFSWAEQAIDGGGAALWASGHLPGVTRITYAIADGTTAEATISSDGYWMVKARTATDFGTAEDNADRKPVTVTITRLGKTTSYAIPWTAETQCDQVSHGC